MGKTIRIRVDEIMKEVLENVGSKLANEIKTKYGIKEIEVPRTLSSRVLAAKHNGKKSMRFEIEKSGMDKGKLRIL